MTMDRRAGERARATPYPTADESGEPRLTGASPRGTGDAMSAGRQAGGGVRQQLNGKTAVLAETVRSTGVKVKDQVAATAAGRAKVQQVTAEPRSARRHRPPAPYGEREACAARSDGKRPPAMSLWVRAIRLRW